MGAPPAATTSASSVPPGPRRRRSTHLIGPRRRDHQDRPPCTPSSAPAPPPESEAEAPPSGVETRRRSARVHLRIRGLPSAASSAPRRRHRSPEAAPRKSIEAKAEEWGREKAALGAPKEECVLPFLQKGAPRMVECLICSKCILPDERIECTVNHCEVTLHKACSEKTDGCCPRHICFYCKRRISRHRVQLTMPACTECSLKQNRMIDSEDLSREVFRRLPLPYTDQEFNINHINKEGLENEREPPPYVHLKRNVYIVKNKRDSDAVEGGCTDCDHDSTCKSCSCRSVLISCSQACHCSVKCSNKPFRREKKIEIVKTQHCGWGVVALESIEKDDFVIEFVGEVIDDVTCEERLQVMRQRGDQNFYMCKVSKDFVIDATFRGNACRFLNHSCQPNCRLEKWQVNGKTRLGVFVSQPIKAGMPLTYNYRFCTYFGPEKKCFCGAPNCQGKL
ncbi:histone-lysine N-methyltransferase ASHR3-like [Phragmites australis]|uniref:histone-lysine N-methyltransferase ASHR3-like n=1 Tax=Phragmites australis TaxID=29695 RepID=UPI002D79015E|nr:histone-lysine N-methyltransferase ASHR3-like [Phragmites australis]